MYKVVLRNGLSDYVIHNTSIDRVASKLTSGTVNFGINSISSFEFTILSNNIGFSRMTPYFSKIIVINQKTGKTVFNGRILKVKPAMSSKGAISKTVICEDRLAYLCDSIQPYQPEKKWETTSDSTGLEKYLDFLLENHNRQVEEEKRIYRGHVNVHSLYQDDSVLKGTNYENTFDVINSKLINVFGGEISLRENPSNGKLYLDYLKEFGEEKKTVIEITKNMKSIDEEIDYSSIFTRLIPLGSKITVKDEAGNEIETEERLTIASVNNGSIWIDTDQKHILGIITKKVEFDSITTPEKLLNKAKEYIEEEKVLTEKHNLAVTDLSLIDSSYDELEVGNTHLIKNHLLELNKKLRIIKKSLDICKPTSSTITVGDTQQTLSDITMQKGKDIADVLQQLTYITSNYVKNTALNNSYSNLKSLIDQTYNQILLKISEEYVTSGDYNDSLEKIAQLELLIDKVTLLVSEVDAISSTQAKMELSLSQIKTEIGSITDVTTTQYGNGSITLEDVSESELIYLRIHPTLTDLAYLYPSEDLYPANDLYLLSRTLLFENEEETILFELPCDLWFYNEENYDEFIIDYESQTMYAIHRIGLDENGRKYILNSEKIEYYDYQSIIFHGGTYNIHFQSFDDAYIYARAMVKNLYTSQYATRIELGTAVTQTEEKIKQSALLKVDNTVFEAYQSLTAKEFEVRVKSGEIISAINLSSEQATINANKIALKASNIIEILAGNTINMTANNITLSSTNFKVDKDGNATLKNLNATGVSIEGNIVATSGRIGGAIINGQGMYFVSGESGWGLWGTTAHANIVFYAGANTGNIGGAPFRILHDGTLYTTKAHITGEITATSGTFTGRINANSGTIAGFNIGSNRLYYGNTAINRNGNVEFRNDNGYFSIGSGAVYLCGNGSGHRLTLSDMLGVSGTGDSNSTIAIRAFYGKIRLASNYGVDINGQSFGSSSSKKTKTNIIKLTIDEIDELYDAIKKMKFYKYDYKKLYQNGRKNNYGFLIEDVEGTILEKLLHIYQDNQDKNLKTYNTEDLTRLLLIVVQQIIKKIESW